MKDQIHPYYDLKKWNEIHAKNAIHLKSLQSCLTAAEVKMKDILETEPFKKYHFQCKQPVGPYIVDFYSESIKLIIQIDTEYTDRKRDIDYELERNKLFEYNGIKTMYLTEKLILETPNGLRALLHEMFDSGFPL